MNDDITLLTTPDGVLLRDRYTRQSTHIDRWDLEMTQFNPVECEMERMRGERREVLRFFASALRTREWAGEYPRIFLLGSKWGVAIPQALERMARETEEDFPDTRGLWVPDDFDESNNWYMRNVGRRFSEYSMHAGLRGWRTYTEEEYAWVEYAWRLVTRLDAGVLGLLGLLEGGK